MFLRKKLISVLPKGFLWKLTLINMIVIVSAISLSGWAIYNTACFLLEGMGYLQEQKQRQFNATLFQYLWIFSATGIVLGSLLHFYFTKKLIYPIRQLIEATKRMKKGEYPDKIITTSDDEIGELVQQYNELIQQLKENETHRHKLVSDLSHEIRTPLSNLNGYLHALQTGVIKGDAHLYHSLYQESSRIIHMVKQLDQVKEWDIEVSKTLVNKSRIDTIELLNQSVAMFEWTLAKSNIQPEVQAESKVIYIQVEGIEQVIYNLLDNAIRYYEGEGPILIKGEALEKEYLISISGPSKQIPKDEKDKLFERFYRLDASRSRETGGTGLGLAIAKEIVERHHGKLGINTNGKYNTFWFTLPYL